MAHTESRGKQAANSPAKGTAEPNAYSVRTLSARWACSPGKVRMMVAKGELPAMRLGKLIRITRAAVLEYEAAAAEQMKAAASSPDEQQARIEAARQAVRTHRIIEKLLRGPKSRSPT